MIRLTRNMTKRDWIFFAVGVLTAGILLAADLLTKQIIIDKMMYNSEIVVIKDFFSITHVRNTGAAWGIFSSGTHILSAVTIVCAVLVLYAIYASTVNKTLLFCFAMILGGACGNLTERLRLGYVTDFLAFTIFGYDFPNFNFADMCITVGCFVLIIYVLFLHKKEKPLFREGTVLHRIFRD